MSANGSDELSALREQRRIALQQQFEEQAKVQADAEIENQRRRFEKEVACVKIVYQKGSLRIYDSRWVAYEVTGKCAKSFQLFRDFDYFPFENAFFLKEN